MAQNLVCNLCKEPAKSQCAGCHLVAYCSKEHQKTDWKTHKLACKPFQIVRDEVLGRHLIATRALRPGDVVLKEAALIWGPNQHTIPVCLGCGQGLDSKTQRPCSKCGWPMCSDVCQNSPAHLPECSYTVDHGEKVSITDFGVVNACYQSITPVRCLYKKQFLPDVWNKLDALQSHCAKRKKTPRYEEDRMLIATVIRRYFKLDVDDETILRICGIINVNAHEMPLSDPSSISIYQIASLFEHNCHSNCTKTFTANREILIMVGSRPIKRGEHLSICYTHPMWSTPNRRHHLYESKYFWCQCQRCRDVTEFGTYFSCILCTDKNCKGIAIPDSFLTLDAPDAMWTCNKCQKCIQNEEVDNLIEDLGKMLMEMQKGSTQAAKRFISKALKHVTRNHYYVTDVRTALAELLGQEFDGDLSDISDEDLLLKIKVCKELTELVAVLAPAENRLRGTILFELHSAITENGQRKGPEEGPDYMFLSLMESKKYLLQAIDALKHECPLMPEGKIYEQAKRNLRDINALLINLQTAITHAP